MAHYFTNDENLKTDVFEITLRFNGKTLVFLSGAGVFSAKKPDGASVMLLKSIPELSGSLLDLGCGYGLIGIALNAGNTLELTQTDINARAVELTALNCAKNGVKSRVFVSDCFENIAESFDTVVLNPPIHAGKAAVFRMFEGARAHLNANGRFYTVILKKHGAKSAIAKLTALFGACEVSAKKKGRFVLLCRIAET